MPPLAYRRVLLKLSGEALMGEDSYGINRDVIERIAAEQTGITADTALRLGKALGTTAQLWLKARKDGDARAELDRTATVDVHGLEGQ